MNKQSFVVSKVHG